MAVKNKKKMAQQKKKRAETKIKKHERDDSLGVSRKKVKFTLNPKIFIILKIVSIILPFICYFLLSIGLFVSMLFSALLMIASILTERYHNKSFIKTNHIKIPKFDSVIAILVMIVTIAGAMIDSNTKMKVPMFEQKSEVEEKIENIATCLTGTRRMYFTRNKFGKLEPPSFDMNFGTKEPPEDMPHMQFPDGMPSFDPGQMPDFSRKFDIDDLPIESLFSTIISTITTVLIFAVPASSIIVLLIYDRKRKNFNKMMNDVVDDVYPELTDEDYFRILTFDGEVIQISTNKDELEN